MRAPPDQRAGRVGVIYLRLLAAAMLLLAAAWQPASADQTDERLDLLFGKLLSTTDKVEAQVLDRLIWTIWLESGDPVLDLLMKEGSSAMAAGRSTKALEAFDAVIEAKPDFAEAWNKRATLYYLLGDYEASARDAKKTLELEPRHFGALSGLGLIHSALDEPREALKWFRQALRVHPHMEEVRRTVRELAEKLEGKPI